MLCWICSHKGAQTWVSLCPSPARIKIQGCVRKCFQRKIWHLHRIRVCHLCFDALTPPCRGITVEVVLEFIHCQIMDDVEFFICYVCFHHIFRRPSRFCVLHLCISVCGSVWVLTPVGGMWAWNMLIHDWRQ